MPRAAERDVRPRAEIPHGSGDDRRACRLRLEPMRLHHVSEIAALEKKVFADPWSADSFLSEVGRRPDVGWPIVVRDATEIVAYAVVWFIVDEIHIGNIAVRPERHGQGIGRWLMEHILEEGRKRSMVFATLEVRPSNSAAIKLYEGFGFRKIAVRRRYYRNNDEDAWVLAIALDPSAEDRLG